MISNSIKYLIKKTLFENKFLRETFTKKKFKKRLSYNLDFNKEPETFNEKVQFRKLYDSNPLFSRYSDKYEVREYVEDKIGKEYLIPMLLVTDKLTEEEYKKLPQSFVAKATHGSGTNKIMFDKGKSDDLKTIKEINNFLKIQYGTVSLELFYNKIKPKIIVEKLLGDGEKLPKDYKFQCFRKNGEFKLFIQIDDGRFGDHRRDIYDENWNLLNLKHNSKYPHLDAKLEKPENFELMKELAKKLSQDFNYVRVDLFNLDGNIYFGELTFCHGGGFEDFEPKSVDLEWGNYWGEEL